MRGLANLLRGAKVTRARIVIANRVKDRAQKTDDNVNRRRDDKASRVYDGNII